jgi:hypothetical protein
MTLSGFAVTAIAQTPATVAAAAGGQGDNYGPGMMNGYGSGYGAGMTGGAGTGYGPGMMNGFGPGYMWSGNSKTAVSDRSEALKQELKITSDEAPAWKTYTVAVTTSDQSFFTAMKTAFDPNSQARN